MFLEIVFGVFRFLKDFYYLKNLVLRSNKN